MKIITAIMLLVIFLFNDYALSTTGSVISDMIIASLDEKTSNQHIQEDTALPKYVEDYSNENSSEISYEIPLDELVESIRGFLSDQYIRAQVELNTDEYPARLRIIHLLGSKDNYVYGGADRAELSEIKLRNTAYDEGLTKNISGYDYLELSILYPDDESIYTMESIWATSWIVDCHAIIFGMEQISKRSSEAEIKKAKDYISEALKTDPKSGFTSELFDAGGIRYATIVSRSSDNMRLLRLQAGNENVSFGIYEVREKVRAAAEKLSWGNVSNSNQTFET